MSDINLLTSVEKGHVQRILFLRVLSIISLVLLFIVIAVAIFLYQSTAKMSSESQKLNSELEGLRTQLSEYQEEAKLVHFLNESFTVVSEFYKDYIDYGMIIENVLLRAKVYPGLRVTNITFDEEKSHVVVRVYGTASDFKSYVTLMKNQEDDLNGIAVKGLFSESDVPEQVNSASSEYLVTLKFDKELAK